MNMGIKHTTAVTNTVTYTSDNTKPVDICFGKLSLEMKKIKQIKNSRIFLSAAR
jgi:hypothetical protein